MPSRLLIPPIEGKSLRIHRSSRPAFRGATGRKSAVAEVGQKQRNFEALMHTVVTCGTLWGGFWLQFVTGMMYNSPALYVLSRGNWFAPLVGFYLPVSSEVPLSLAECFAGLSVFGSVLALVGVWHWTRGVRGRWRMRMLVAGFVGFLSLWALAAWAAKDAAWQALEDRRAQIQRELQQMRGGSDGGWFEMLKSEQAWIEQMLKMKPESE